MITSIPQQNESAGQLGKAKADGSGLYDADTKIKAAQWNQAVLRLIELYSTLGLSDGSTAGSLIALMLASSGKPACKLAATTNVPDLTVLCNGGSLDGKGIVTGDRIFLPAQTDATQNGPYVAKASGAPDRAPDWDTAADTAGGGFYAILGGNANSGSVFVCNTANVVPGSTATGWTHLRPHVAGQGIVISGAATGEISVDFGGNTPQPIGTTGSPGNSGKLPDENHVHALPLSTLADVLGSGDVNVTGPVGINASGVMAISGHGGDASVSTGSIGEVVISTGDGLLAEFSDRVDLNGALLTGVGDGGADTDGVNWRALRNSESVKKTTAYTLLSGDPRIIQVDDTAGRVDLTLPNPNTQRVYTIHKVAGTTGGIRLVRHASEKIMTVAASYDLPGATTAFSPTAPQAWLVYTDGADWFVC